MSFALSLLILGTAAEPPIIVTAPRTEQALAECLARRCGVREDAITSIRHAQAQFSDGAYPEARKTLLASLHRNRRANDQDPRALSALWHALARVTLHNGDLQEYRRAALRSGSILARSTAVTPSERARGEVQMADALSMTGDPDGAVRGYRRVGNTARASGDVELAQIMELRAIYARSTFDGRPAARRALERAAQDGTLMPRARTAALALAAQLQTRPGAKSEALLNDVPVQPADAPTMLLWAPKTSLSEQREAVNRALANNDSTLFNLLQPRSSEAKRYSWVDIGFWIRPDGRVEEVEVLRGSQQQGWTKDVVRSVKGRRYAAFQAGSDADGRYKIERVTLTFEHQTPSGSLIRRRTGLPSYRFEELRVEQGGRLTGSPAQAN
jgi:hypothetical protein